VPRQLIAIAAVGLALVLGPPIGSARAQPAAPAPDGGLGAPRDPAPPPGSQGAEPAAAAPDGGLFAPPAPTPPPGSQGADPAATSGGTSPSLASDEIGDQAIAAELGLAAGGRATPGGLRIAGHYLYQLSERDWFDGTASFTFGSGRAGCFRDRSDALVCGHGLADGAGAELSVNVRRLFVPQGAFRPFARAGAGLGIVRFGDDEVSGFAVVLHGGGGVRVKVAPSIAVVADGDLGLGFGSFSRGLGFEPQFSFVVTAGAEFRLR
jgi:hypothetical protein